MKLLLISIIAGILFGIVVITPSVFAVSESKESEWQVYTVSGNFYLPNYKLTYQVFKIPYQITNAEVEKIEVPDQSEGPFHGGGTIVNIVTKGDGILKIQIPRNVPMGNMGDIGNPFILVDGEEVRRSTQYKESQTTCFWEFTIPFKGGNKEIDIFGTSTASSSQGPIRGIEVPPECVIKPSPKSQIANGVLPENVTCKEGLQLIFKSKDNSPACVKPQTAEKLVERGWGYDISAISLPVPENVIEQPNSMKTIKVTNTDFTINYTITGGEILGTDSDLDGGAILLSLMTTSDGEITIIFPRIQTNTSCTGEVEFFVLVDGREIHYEKMISPTERRLTFKFTDGAKEIEIIGQAMCYGMPSGASPFLK